jgi:hypothetical protein
MLLQQTKTLPQHYFTGIHSTIKFEEQDKREGGLLRTVMVCLASSCRCRPCNGIIQGCANLESITMDPPTIITSNYEDQCGCRTCCTYPNYAWAVVPAQILTTIALALTSQCINGCSVIKVVNTPESGTDEFIINKVFNGTIPNGRINNNATYRSLGLFTWENVDGICVDGENGDDYDWSTIRQYWRMLAGDFERIPVFVLAVVATGVAVGVFASVVFLWLVTLPTCVAHTRRHRAVLILLLTIGMPTVQPLLFLLLQTDLCRKNKCELGRWGKLSILAMFLYFFAGMILLLATKDFPGNPYKEREPMMRFNVTSYFSPRSQVASDTGSSRSSNLNNQHFENVNPAPDVELTNYGNGFADAIEIPVESEFIDRTLIESEAGPIST